MTFSVPGTSTQATLVAIHTGRAAFTMFMHLQKEKKPIDPLKANHNKSCLLLSSAEMF